METMGLARRTRKKEASETPSTTWSSPEDLWTKEGTRSRWKQRSFKSRRLKKKKFASETKTSLNDYDEWQKNTSKEARKKWNDVSKRNGEETTFKVGRQDVDEKFLSEVLLYLFKSNDQKVPAHLFLNKIKRSMTLDGYKAILVGCGRANKWELCEQIIDFVKKENKEDQKDASLDGIVTANWFVAIIDARIKEKSFADVASCF